MSPSREFRSKAFALSPRFAYLPASDRHLFARPQPAHRLNLIGAGFIGMEHLRVTLLEGRASIHGVYDPNSGSVAQVRQAMAQLAPGAPLVIYDSLEAACNDPAADGLIIATPNHTHIEVARIAASSGKHILLEKPMATTLADAAEIVALADGHGAVFQVGLQYRYKPIYVEARHEALARRSIGAVKTMSIVEHRVPFLDKVGQWNKFARSSGGTLVEKCCHYFDLFNLFAGARPVSVYAVGDQAVNFRDFSYGGERSDIVDSALVIVSYANGVRASFNLCMFAPLFYEELVLCGDEGRLKVFEQQDFLPGPRPHAGLELHCGEGRPSRSGVPAYPSYIEESGHSGGTYYEHVAFLDAIEGLPSEAATVREGFWSVVVGIAAEASLKGGAPVQIDELLARSGIALDSF